MAWLCFDIFDSAWITRDERAGSVNLLGFIYKTTATGGQFYRFLNDIYRKADMGVEGTYIALAVVIYGPRRLWVSSTAIHPLRLCNYVLGCLTACLFLTLLLAFGGFYESDPIKSYVPSIAERLEDALFTPIAEEFLFRLTLFQVVRSKLGFVEAALISSVAFGLVHYGYPDPMKIMTIFVASMVLAWSYEKTGTILTPIGIHVLNNTLNQILNY